MNESQPSIEELLAQLPEERLPNEWLFSIEMGYWIIAAILILIAITAYFAIKKAKKTKSIQRKINAWQNIVNNSSIDDRTRIEQANSLIKINITGSQAEQIKTLNGEQWFEYLQQNFQVNINTITLLANGHYQAQCKIENMQQFNHDIHVILKECIYA